MKEHLNKREIIEKITPVIENTAMRYNLIPLEISLTKESERWFLRIFIYSADHSITHKDCENITRGLGELLNELIPFKYYLEVSSPGTDRKLKTAREYVIFKGKTALVKIKNPVDESGDKKIKAKLLDYNDGMGLRILKLDTGKEYTLKPDEIFSVQLDENIGEKDD